VFKVSAEDYPKTGCLRNTFRVAFTKMLT